MGGGNQGDREGGDEKVFYVRFIDYGAVVMATVLPDVKPRDTYGRRPFGIDASL